MEDLNRVIEYCAGVPVWRVITRQESVVIDLGSERPKISLEGPGYEEVLDGGLLIVAGDEVLLVSPHLSESQIPVSLVVGRKGRSPVPRSPYAVEPVHRMVAPYVIRDGFSSKLYRLSDVLGVEYRWLKEGKLCSLVYRRKILRAVVSVKGEPAPLYELDAGERRELVEESDDWKLCEGSWIGLLPVNLVEGRHPITVRCGDSVAETWLECSHESSPRGRWLVPAGMVKQDVVYLVRFLDQESRSVVNYVLLVWVGAKSKRRVEGPAQ